MKNPQELKKEHQRTLDQLSKKHIIWIRDVHFKQAYFTDGMPWPQANLLGKAWPIFDFIECFNPEFAHEGFDNAMNTNVHLENILLKDYFVRGEEGFSFPVNDEIMENEDTFNECLNKLYNKYPHLLQEVLV